MASNVAVEISLSKTWREVKFLKRAKRFGRVYLGSGSFKILYYNTEFDKNAVTADLYIARRTL